MLVILSSPISMPRTGMNKPLSVVAVPMTRLHSVMSQPTIAMCAPVRNVASNAADGVVQGLPSQTDGVCYLVSAPVADAMAGGGRTDLFRLPPDASSNAPPAFGMDYLIQVV